ncbi:hypothetical protein FO519_003205 [Halicephalobus sp. NKZ332]|nr:hypothetical protein FO519_003205 [Halicephalobus sp. NKZ332]
MAPPGGSRGKPPVGPPSSYHSNNFGNTRCRCCPYGFHIDLDFVKFAENVTSGTDNVQKWNTNPRRMSRRKFPHSSMDDFPLSMRNYKGSHSFDGADDLNSTMDSMMSQSINVGYTSATEDEQPMNNEFLSFSNGYLNKNKSDSQVMKLIQELNGIENARKPPIPPPLSSSSPYPGVTDNVHQRNSRSPYFGGPGGLEGFNHRGTRGSSFVPYSESAGATEGLGQRGARSGSVNAEVQEIFSRQHFNKDFAKTAASAPNSPIPTKSYHLSVAQLSNRKNINNGTPTDPQEPPVPPPRRYFDSARPRVLSPEPGARDLNLPPTVLRTSNFHSRSFFSSNPSPPDSGSSSTNPTSYRSRIIGASSFSGGLDFDSFASVRRQKTSDDGGYRNRTFSPTAPGLRLDGYTSDAEYRSATFSPPPVRRFYEYRTEEKPPEVPRRTAHQFVEQQSFDSTSSVEQQKPAVLTEHRESQTISPILKNASTAPITSSFSSQETQTKITEFEDFTENFEKPQKLEEKSKKKSQDCTVEFQFALGHEPEHHPDEVPEFRKSEKEFKEAGTDPVKKALFSTGINTVKIQTSEKGCMPMPPPVKPKTSEKGEIQTEDDWIEIEVQKRLELEKLENSKKIQNLENTKEPEKHQKSEDPESQERRSIDKMTETEDEELGEFIVITCTNCEKSKITDNNEDFQKIQINEEMDPVSQSESMGDRESGFSNSSTDLEEFERIEKAIQEEVHRESPDSELNPNSNPDLDSDLYPDHNSHPDTDHELDPELPPEPLVRHSMPPDPDYSDLDSASLDTVSINTVIHVEPMKVEKKAPLVKTIDPSKIEALRKLLTEPRQNFSRDSGAYRSVKLPKTKTTDDLEYIANKHSEEKDTLDQVILETMPSEGSSAGLVDVMMLKKALPTSPIPEPIPAKIPRPKISKYSIPLEQAVTPDEEAEAADKLTPLRSELRSLAAWGSAGGPSRNLAEYRRYVAQQNQNPQSEDEIEGEVQNSGASSDSDATYDLSDEEETDGNFEVTEPLKDALETLDTHLRDPDSIATQAVEWGNKYIQHEWLKMTTKKKANFKLIENFLDFLDKNYSIPLMALIVNFSDSNGNTALHYAVSHENYDLVSVLLDSKHGQTALQLAASHGRIQTTQLLLDCGADVNVKDVDGSTALMCAAEWGRKEIVKMLLQAPNIDASLTDCDNQTALSIAIDQKHKAIALLIYAHLNFTRFESGDHSTV